MESGELQLKFGTALFLFRDLEQMESFLSGNCFRDKNGKVWLHHGCTYHDFTELVAEYYSIIPVGFKFRKRKRKNFMLGKMDDVLIYEEI